MPSSIRRPRRWKSTPARAYSPGWLPTPTPRTKRPPERCWSAVACLATAAGLAQRKLQDAGAQRGPPGGGRRDGQRGEALVDRVGPEEVVDGPQGVGPGRLGPPAELGDVSRRASGTTRGTTTFIREFSLQGGGEDQSERWEAALRFLPASHRHVTPRRRALPTHSRQERPTGSVAAPGAAEHGQGAARGADGPARRRRSRRSTRPARSARPGAGWRWR